MHRQALPKGRKSLIGRCKVRDPLDRLIYSRHFRFSLAGFLHCVRVLFLVVNHVTLRAPRGQH